MIERTTYKLKGTLRIDFETDRARLDSFPALESDWNKLLHRLTKADEPLRYHDGDGEEDMLYPFLENQELTVFAVNRNMDETAEVSLDFEGFGELTLAEHMVLNNDDMKAVNSPENPENVVPKKGTGVKDGVVILEPHSYNIVRFYTK